MADPYEEALDAEDEVDPYEAAIDATPATSKGDQLRAVYEGAQTIDPDQHAEAIKLSADTGAPLDVVAKELPKFKALKSGKDFDPDRWAIQEPDLARMALEDPEVGHIVMRDGQLSVFAQAINKSLDVEKWVGENLGLDWLKDKAGIDVFASPTDAPERLFEIGKSLYTGTPLPGAAQERESKRKIAKPTAYVQDALTKYREGQGLWGQVGAVGDRFDETTVGMDISKLQFELLTRRGLADVERKRREVLGLGPDESGMGDTADLEKRILDLKRISVPRDYNEGPVQQVFTDVAQAAASQIAIYKDAGKGGVAGMIVGGTIGGIATKSPAGVRAGALKGFSIGSKVGMAIGSLRLEAGDAYGELLDMRTDDGEPLTEEEARGGALLYGGLAAVVELASEKQKFRAMGPLGTALLAGEKKAALAELLHHAGKDTLRQIARRAGTEWLKSSAGEGGEEFIQDAMQQAAGFLALSKHAGAIQKGPVVDWEQSALAGQKGLVGALGPGLGGFALNVGTFTLAQDRALQGGHQVNALLGLADSPTVKAAPEAVAKMIADSTAKGGDPLTHLYVDPQAFHRLFQSEHTDADAANQAATELLGPDGPRVLQEAIATGSKLAIPVEDYLSRWGGTEAAQKLVGDTTTGLNRATPNEMKAIEPAAKALAAQIEKEEAAGKTSGSEGEAAWADAWQEQLVATGKYATPEDARTAIAPLRALIRTQAEVHKVDAGALFSDLRLQIIKGDNAAAVADTALAQPPLPPAASQALTATLLSEGYDVERNLLTDSTTGALGDRAWERIKTTAQKVGVISVEGVKFQNDRAGHEAGNDVYRAAARALVAAGLPNVAKVKGDFAIDASGLHQKQLDAILAKANADPALQGFTLSGAIGENLRKAAKFNNTTKKNLETEGKRAARGVKPLGATGAMEFERKKVEGLVIPPALSQAVKDIKGKAAFEEMFVDKPTRLLNKDGFDASPPAKFELSGDMDGIKEFNDILGEKAVDKLIDAVGQEMTLAGAAEFDGAHISGDEFKAKGNDLEALKAFGEKVREVLQTAIFKFKDEDGAPVVVRGVGFSFGIGEHTDAAEAGLHSDKDARLAAGKRGEGKAAARIASGTQGDAQAGAPIPIGVDGDERARLLADRGQRYAGPEEAVAAPPRLEQPAFHGTPHDFDSFTTEKIGTGEGAQVYGWGLYFASRKEVGEHYRQVLSESVKLDGKEGHELSQPEHLALLAVATRFTSLGAKKEAMGQAIEDAKDSLRRDVAGLEEARSHDAPEGGRYQRRTFAIEMNRAALAALDTWSPDRLTKSAGQLFKVEVPEDSELLDYEAPLDQQPPGVLQKLTGYGFFKEKTEDGKIRLPNREQMRADLIDGRVIYKALAERYGSDEQASQLLRSLGIPGLRYQDQNSRGLSGGTHNYVIWEDQKVKVLEKFYQGDPLTGPRGYTDIAREGLNKVFKIALNKNADLSTFLHESGHVFLFMLGDLAARADAPERVKSDWATTLKWMGVEKTSDIKREHHEKWATSFEAYLLKGVAPSADLVGPFERFRIWLKRVYRSMAVPGADLNKEISGVFDRLIATDDEIERTKRAMGLRPMLTAADFADPAQYEEYLHDVEKAASHASRAAELRAMKDKLREQESWWKEEEGKLKDAAAEEYDKLPSARAYGYLQRGVLAWTSDAGVDRATNFDARPKLDRAAVVAAIGEKAAKAYVTVAKDGVHPDEIAELFGYPTGAAMLEAVTKLPEKAGWVDQRAREGMSEAHPDILADRTQLKELVAKGLHGDFTAKWLETEWAALRAKSYVLTENPEANKTQAIPRERLGMSPAPIESIRRAAKMLAERRTIGKLNAGAALIAERAASEKAAKFALAGDYAAAAVAKQQQLLNLHLYRELSAAQEQRDAFLDRAAAASKIKARARLGKAGPVYRGGVDLVLEALGLKSTEPRERPLPSLAEVATKIEEDGSTVGFDEDLVGGVLARAANWTNQSGTKSDAPWKALTVTEMRAVDGALRNIIGAAAARTTALIDGKRVDRQETVEKLLAEGLQNLPSLGPIASSESAKSLPQIVAGGLASFDGSLLKPEVLADWLGGGDLASTWFRAIIKPLQDAKHAEADLLKSTIKPIIAAFEAMPAKVRASFMSKIDGKALFPDHAVAFGQQLEAPTRRFELLMMALNSGNASNLDRLLKGRSISEEQLRKAIDLLSKEELDWVQSVWDAAEALWPAARDLEERDSGLPPPKLELKPLETRHGTYRGGYFPAIYDRRVEAAGERQVASTVAQLMDPSFTRPGTAHSHLKGRVEGFTGAISLEPNAIPTHLAQVVHDLAFREPLKSVGGLVLEPSLQAMLKDRLGEGRSKQFLQWLKDVGTMRGVEGMTHSRILLKAARGVRSNTVIAALGYSAANAIEDLSNLVAAVPATDLKAKHLLAGMAELGASPIAAVEMAESKSGELRFRRDHVQREMAKQIKSLTSRFSRGPLAFIKEHAFIFMEFSDKYTSTPIWLGAYRQGLAENRGEADAVTYADSVIRKIYASHSPVDAAALLRDKGFIGTSLMFYGFLNNQYNRIRDITHALHTAADGAELAKRLPKVGGKLLAYMLASSVLSEFLRGRGKEDDEDWAQWFLRKMLAGGLSSLPLGGDAANAIEGAAMGKQTNPRNNSIVGVAGALGKALYEASDDEKDGGKRIKALLSGLGPVIGNPSVQPNKSLGYLMDVDDGTAEPRGPFDVAGGAIYGEKAGHPKNPFTAVQDLISGER